MKVNGYKARLINGKWHAIVYWTDDSDKRHQKSRVIGVVTEKEANESAHELYIMCKNGLEPLVADARKAESAISYAESYFKGRLERHEYERSTYATNLKHLRAWQKVLGDKKLQSVTEKDVKDAISGWFSDGRDATTVDKRMTALKEVYTSAMRDGLCQRNPFEHVKRPKKGFKELNGANDADTRAGIADVLERLPLDSMKVAFNLAFWTGMRRGEVCGLRWCDVDLEKRSVWVRSSIGTDDVGKYVKPPKSNRPRDLYMPEKLHLLLVSWKREQVRLHGARFDSHMYVVCDNSGCYLNPDYVTHSFTALARFCGWKGAAGRRMTLHDLRHTVATALIAQNADVKTVQSVLGHSSAAITLDMYASADSYAKRRAAGLLEQSISESAPKGAQAWAASPTERSARGCSRANQ